MTRLQELIADAPTGAGTRTPITIDRLGAAAPAIGLLMVVLIAALAVTVFFGPGTAGVAPTTPAAAEVDGWQAAVRAASHERTMARAAVTVDGWSAGLLTTAPEAVDGWAARYLDQR